MKVSRFTSDFLSYLAAADLSVSMAGYNTCMNVLASRVPSLVWPFAQNREQRLRAEVLQDRGLVGIIEDKGPGAGPAGRFDGGNTFSTAAFQNRGGSGRREKHGRLASKLDEKIMAAGSFI